MRFLRKIAFQHCFHFRKDRIIKYCLNRASDKNSLNSIYSDGNEFLIVGDSGTILQKKTNFNEWSLTELDGKVGINDFWRFSNGNKIFIGDRSSFVYENNGNLQWYSILDQSYLL